MDGRRAVEMTIQSPAFGELRRRNVPLKIYSSTENGREYVRVECDAPVWGVWSVPNNDANYVCLEPWYGICDYEGFEGEISERPYTNVVESGETWTGGNVIRVM
jgi:galactose mutarotase-like enzyme